MLKLACQLVFHSLIDLNSQLGYPIGVPFEVVIAGNG